VLKSTSSSPIHSGTRPAAIMCWCSEDKTPLTRVGLLNNVATNSCESTRIQYREETRPARSLQAQNSNTSAKEILEMENPLFSLEANFMSVHKDQLRPH
jgi:hypothetical protein